MTNEEATNVLGDVRAYLASRASLENEILAGHTFIDICNAIKSLEQEPCEDAVSRKEVLNQIFYSTDNSGDVVLGSNLRKRIEKLPPVTPTRKKGHWIEHSHEAGENWEYSKYECSECHVWTNDDSDFCPNCGAEMEDEE